MIRKFLTRSSDNFSKYNALRDIGIKVERIGYKLVITMESKPDLDNFIDTTFNNLDEILYSFRDELSKQNIKVA
jgi:hypothetical protein